jgi:hypothetical protein
LTLGCGETEGEGAGVAEGLGNGLGVGLGVGLGLVWAERLKARQAITMNKVERFCMIFPYYPRQSALSSSAYPKTDEYSRHNDAAVGAPAV